MGRLYWSRKFRDKEEAERAMEKKKGSGYDVSGLYVSPDNKYFFISEEKVKRK